MLGLGLLAPLALHTWRRWPRPRKTDFTSRRGALKLLGLGAAGLAGWWGAEALASARSQSGAPRRFTGSRQDGLFSGNRFPVTHSIPVQEGEIDLSTWRLDLSGAVDAPQLLTYEAILAHPGSSKVATLDCTLGWYTTQTWSGILLNDLLAKAGASPRAFGVRLESVTGYAQILPMAEIGEVLLATQVGGEALDHWHGFPLRAVVPSRRGWHWVKWLARVEVVNLTLEIRDWRLEIA
jgi:DMSO/TMAO reductase YedYZ molybdopterin-dependent catalytic subunit